MSTFHFISSSSSTELAFSGSYSPSLVVVSVSIAILAAFASIGHVDLMRATPSPRVRRYWQVMGAVSMGIGIWAMHFVGMVAFKLPVEVYYSAGSTFVSLLPAILAGYLALGTLRKSEPNILEIFVGGVFMGLGTSAMHYIGMSGMLVHAKMAYHPVYFALSIIIAVIMASIALAVPRLLAHSQGKYDKHQAAFVLKLVSALIMGLSISSMHYVAMSATVFLPVSGEPPSDYQGLDGPIVTTLSVVGSVLLLVVMMVVSVFRSRTVEAEALAVELGEEARQLENRFSKLVSRLPGAVFQFRKDSNGKMSFPYASNSIKAVHGVTVSELTADADNLFKTVHPDDLVELMGSIQESASTLSEWLHEYRVLLPRGERWLQVSSSVEILGDGSLLWSGFVTDVTERNQREARIYELAFYDELTGLPNQRLLQDRLDVALVELGRSTSYGTLVFFSVDNFESPNEALVQGFTDDFLRVIASNINKYLRGQGTFSRLGGDEFAILFKDVGSDEEASTQRAMELANNVLKVLTQPIELHENQYQCSANLGVSIFSGLEQSSDEVLRRADSALYESKAIGQCTIRFYDPDTELSLEKRFRWGSRYQSGSESGVS